MTEEKINPIQRSSRSTLFSAFDIYLYCLSSQEADLQSQLKTRYGHFYEIIPLLSTEAFGLLTKIRNLELTNDEILRNSLIEEKRPLPRKRDVASSRN